MIPRRTLALLACAALAACALRAGGTRRRTLAGVTAHQAEVAARRVLAAQDLELEEDPSEGGVLMTEWLDRADKSRRYEVSVQPGGDEGSDDVTVAVLAEKRDRAVSGWTRGYPDPSAAARLLAAIEREASEVPAAPPPPPPPPEEPTAEPERECASSRECPPGQHCTGRGRCVWECASDDECEAPARCDRRGRCIPPTPPPAEPPAAEGETE